MSEQQEQQKQIIFDSTSGSTFIKGKMLGSGGFAKCYQAINPQDYKIYAAKVIPKKSISQKRQRYKLLVEIKLHRGLKHKHIVEFISSFEDKQNVYILLEYCRNYTLKQLVKRRKRLTEHEGRVYTRQIIKALQYIHENGIIHRDLKLGNILINQDMQTKICDFGLSTRVKKQGQIKKTICGTPNYIAPQVLQQQGHSYQVDIWSVGVILYTLIVGKPPFEDHTVEQTYQNIRNNRYMFPSQLKFSSAVKDLISKILVMNPAKRLTLQGILQHEFMQVPQWVGYTLPRSTLAVPPIEPIKNNLNYLPFGNDDDSSQISNIRHIESIDTNSLQQSQEIQRRIITQQERRKSEIYLRQILEFEGNYGYLLSNGVIGAYLKNEHINVILEFGSENYIRIKEDGRSTFEFVPQNQDDYSPQLTILMRFRVFYITKYSFLKLDQMHKRIENNEENYYIKKISNIAENQYLVRMSNDLIHLLFGDSTTVFINKNDTQGIFYSDSKGRKISINYEKCSDNKIKTKIRKFSHLLQKIQEKKNHKLHK